MCSASANEKSSSRSFPLSSASFKFGGGYGGIALISSKLMSVLCVDAVGLETLDELPADEEKADPDRLARPAIDCAKRAVLGVLDCRRTAEEGAGVD